jgi:hypothetical protein
MLMSGRDARAVLELAGWSSRQAREALECGLAGEPVRTRAAHLYDEERVRALASRPIIEWQVVADACPTGIFVARRRVDARLARDDQLNQVARGWQDVSIWTWLAIGLHLRIHGSLPFVTTVASGVLLGADIVGLSGGTDLVLGPPGGWFDRLEDARLLTGPGRPWVLHLSVGGSRPGATDV